MSLDYAPLAVRMWRTLGEMADERARAKPVCPIKECGTDGCEEHCIHCGALLGWQEHNWRCPDLIRFRAGDPDRSCSDCDQPMDDMIIELPDEEINGVIVVKAVCLSCAADQVG